MKIGTINEEAEKILNSKKYRYMDPATVRDILYHEFARFRNKKQALESARARIHQVWADYLGNPPVDKLKVELVKAFDAGGNEAVKNVCMEILKTHKSTGERVAILEEFYAYILSQCASVKIVIDLASAMNPFAIPWMHLPEKIKYHAYDINRQYVEFVNFYFKRMNLPCLAEQRDIYIHLPVIRGDLTFYFKMYHCLEKRRRGAGMDVLQNIKSSWIALTFPTRTLADRSANIASNYEGDIYSYAEERGWTIKRKIFSTEDLFLIRCLPLIDNKNGF